MDGYNVEMYFSELKFFLKKKTTSHFLYDLQLYNRSE